jgi:hypothetical protein
MATTKRPFVILAIIGFVTLFSFTITAKAQQPIDCLLCQNMTMTTIVETGDLIIMGFEGKGIVLDNTESKFFDNSTVHLLGQIKIDKGKATGSFIGKYLDPSGDFYVIEGSQVGAELDWKFIYGTGKFKGITGAGKSIRFTKGKPVSPGTSQVCSKITGTYELKK